MTRAATRAFQPKVRSIPRRVARRRPASAGFARANQRSEAQSAPAYSVGSPFVSNRTRSRTRGSGWSFSLLQPCRSVRTMRATLGPLTSKSRRKARSRNSVSSPAGCAGGGS